MYLAESLSSVLIRLTDTAQRRGVWREYRHVMESQWFSREKLADLQSEKLTKRIRFAAERSPFVRQRLSDAGVPPETIRTVADLKAVPILEKDDIRRNGAALQCTGLDRRRVLPNSTGGSTGSNVQFFVDRDCWRARNAMTMRRLSFLGLSPGARVATVWGSPMDLQASQKLKERARRLVDNVRLFSAYRLNRTDLDQVLGWISKNKPQVLVGYASVLDELARRAGQRGGIGGPRYVISSAETLFPDQRERIEEGFGATVFNQYGCREVGLIAMECPTHNGLHLMDERLVVESVLGEGTTSEILLTDLDNNATPFIRYRVGDLAVQGDDEPCSCGRGLSRLTEVAGRTFDLIRGPSGNAVGGTFWSLLLRTAVKGIVDFQVIQHKKDVIEIRTTPRGGLSPSDHGTIERRVREVLGGSVVVRFTEESELVPLPSGKHRFVVRAPELEESGE